MKIKLRKADKSELPMLQTFAREVIDKNYREHLGDEAVDWFIGSGASDQYMQDSIDDTILAVMDEQTVGICICKEELIDLLMIQNGMQNRGIGSAFLTLVSEELLKQYTKIRVECFEKNGKANRFYVRNGWTQEKITFDEEMGDNRIYYCKTREQIK